MGAVKLLLSARSQYEIVRSGFNLELITRIANLEKIAPPRTTPKVRI
jgi:hypothetical protein